MIIPILLVLAGGASTSASPPNIILLLTDDQDVTAHSLDYMPKLNTIMREGGVEFVNFFVSTALCCPSRMSLLKGQYCHNHGIWDNGELNNATFSSGGLKKIVEEELESETVVTLMRGAGYETFLIGKYVNGYSDQFARHVPLGWDHWHGMTKASYYGSHFSDDGKLVKTCNDTYQTDYISKHARNMIINRSKSKPFFMYIAPFAPHAPSKPAKRHANMFINISAPRSESFNPGDNIQSQKPSWLRALPKLTAEQIADVDELYRNRLRTLQAVDEMLEDITLLLAHEGIEDNTYLFYMGDNGMHFGDFRLAAGKRQAYDTDIRVPFLAKGPGITGGTKVTEVAMSIDLMPTWLELANGKSPSSYVPDGLSIVPFLNDQAPRQPAQNTFRAAALVEMYGGSSNIGSRYRGMEGFHGNKFWNNTYRAVRVINGSGWTSDADWLYVEWCTGEREFYNVTRDKQQIYNVIDDVDAGLLQKLSILIATLGRCVGKGCSNISLADIAQETESHSGSVASHVECLNPTDTGGQGFDPPWPLGSACDAVLEQGDFCKNLVSNGFSFSDEEPVSDMELEVWECCFSNT